MGTVNLKTASGGSVILSPANTAVDVTITVPASNATMLTTPTATNIVQGTAGQGINFTANTPTAGVTSQLLNWYEEGTWTPNQGAALTLVGAFSSAGTYTRIGRCVNIVGSVSGATSVAVSGGGPVSTNLPFTAATRSTGSAANSGATTGGNTSISGATMFCTAIAATTTIYFSATYFV